MESEDPIVVWKAWRKVYLYWCIRMLESYKAVVREQGVYNYHFGSGGVSIYNMGIKWMAVYTERECPWRWRCKEPRSQVIDWAILCALDLTCRIKLDSKGENATLSWGQRPEWMKSDPEVLRWHGWICCITDMWQQMCCVRQYSTKIFFNLHMFHLFLYFVVVGKRIKAEACDTFWPS